VGTFGVSYFAAADKNWTFLFKTIVLDRDILKIAPYF
jgi:hypothetical protein